MLTSNPTYSIERNSFRPDLYNVVDHLGRVMLEADTMTVCDQFMRAMNGERDGISGEVEEMADAVKSGIRAKDTLD